LNRVAFFGAELDDAQFCNAVLNDENSVRLRALVIVNSNFRHENTGVSAYDGAAASIVSVDLLNAAGTIVAVEARHASYLNLVSGEVPFPAAFETPLTPAEVLAAAGPLIVSNMPATGTGSSL